MRIVLAALGACLVASSCEEAPAIPSPDTSSMETEVARRILEERDAVSSQPRSGERWGGLGMVFHAHDLFREAKESYAAARTLDDLDFRWPYLEARCSLSLQDLGSALDAVRAAIEMKPSYSPLYVLEAELHEKANRLEDAVDSYRKALSIDSRSAAAELGIGRIELERGNIEAGREHLENAARLEPGSGSIQAMLARAYQRAGDRERARVVAERAAALPPEVSLDDPVMVSVLEKSVSVSGYQRRAAEAEARGDMERAEALLRHLVAIRPNEADFHFNLANHLSRRKRTEDARWAYEKALELDPGHTGALVNLGILLIQDEKSPQAKALFAKVLELEPEHAGALASMAKLLALEGDLSGAIYYFEGALAVEPNQVDSHFGMGQVLRHEGKIEQAIAAFSRALDLAPARADIHFELAATYAASGDYSKAWRHVQSARNYGLLPPEKFISALSERMAEPKNH